MTSARTTAAACLSLLAAGAARACEPLPAGTVVVGPSLMQASENTATLHAGLAIALAVAFVLIQVAWRRTLVSWTLVPVFLAIALHPRWSLGVMNGDCGVASADYSVWITVALAAAVVVQAGRWMRARRAGPPGFESGVA